MVGSTLADDRIVPTRRVIPPERVVGRKRRRSRGQTLVEFGIIAPLLILLLINGVDFGQLINTWLAVSNAASTAARQASVGVPPTNLTSVVTTNLNSQSLVKVASGNITVTVTYCNPNPPSGVAACPTALPTTLIAAAYGGSCSAACKEPQANDQVTVQVAAAGQVFSPLIHGFFQTGNAGLCPNSSQTCLVPLHTKATMRFEGQYVQ